MPYQTPFVLDCSVTMAWCFEDESTSSTDQLLDSLQTTNVIVPTIWPLEVANVLLFAEKKKRITTIEITQFLDTLSLLPIEIDNSTSIRAKTSIFHLAKTMQLTIYDAAYLELAQRGQIPLATLDKALIKSAKKLNIEMLN